VTRFADANYAEGNQAEVLELTFETTKGPTSIGDPFDELVVATLSI